VANTGAAEVKAFRLQHPSDGKLEDFRPSFQVSIEEDSPVCQAMADKYFRKNRKLAIAVTRTDLLELA
jgi:hypothetical protein